MHSKFIIILLGIVLSIVLFGCSTTLEFPHTLIARVTPIAESDSDGFIKILNEEIPKLLDEHQVPGLAISLIHQGKIIWSKGFGLSNIKYQTPVDKNTVFQVASLSKSLTALGILKLVEDGKIDLDAPVETYLSSWRIPRSQYATEAVTIRRLLNHTAGLSVIGYPGFPPDHDLPTIVESLNGEFGSQSILSSIYNYLFLPRRKVYLINEPGTRTQYSGGGYTVLQLLIEDVTGKTYSNYMKSEVLKPLGMHNSSFTYEDDVKQKTAIAYSGTLIQEPSPNYIYTAKAAAGLYSTNDDLAKFMTIFFTDQKHTLLKENTIKIMLESNLGIWRERHNGDIDLYGHSGANIGGWNAIYQVAPANSAGITILTNGSEGGIVWFTILEMWYEWMSNKTSDTKDHMNN